MHRNRARRRRTSPYAFDAGGVADPSDVGGGIGYSGNCPQRSNIEATWMSRPLPFIA